MDPDTALEMLKHVVRDYGKGSREAMAIRENLSDWVANGGFEPSDPKWRSV